MNREVLARIIVENQESIFHRTRIQRDYYVTQTEHISVLVGIRRSGKTSMLYNLAQQYKKEEVLFLDFEDERLLELNSLSNYDILLDTYYSIFPDVKPVLFFDEIQNLKNWHFYLKRLHVAGYRIFVTGSNANMISKEIATFLKGRSLETTIYPFSFDEFLRLKEISFTERDKLSNIPNILYQFDQYLQYGGFPEVIKTDIENKRLVAQNIYNLLFYKDLVVKYDKNDYLLKLIVNKLTENITKEFSISNFSNKITPFYQTSRQTITDYFNILPEPFLTSNIYPYRTSFVVRQSKRKTYLADNSFIYLNRITTDKSRQFENTIANHLIRSYDEVYYYKTANGKEVDFMVIDDGASQFIQVSYTLTDLDTKQREVSALLTAMDEQNIQLAYIYTYNEKETLTIDKKTIEIIPFWNIALNEHN